MILEVRHLKTHFTIGNSWLAWKKPLIVKAVNDLSFQLQQGEVLSLVGESGCGKSTVGRSLTRLTPITDGSIQFNGQELTTLNYQQFKPLRRDLQMIFQDPFASLNPRLTIEQTLSEPLFIFGLANNKQQARQQIANMLTQVGLDETAMQRYPHEFSGGQRQRICIAKVMILSPKLIIADEAVSALDVSIQAQILNLLKELQQKYQTAMLFISHNLGVVRYISDRIAVMYLGKIVESAPNQELFNNPQHPYTQLLLKSIPKTNQPLTVTGDDGEPASATNPPSGCSFHPRCLFATKRCRTEAPKLIEHNQQHMIACHFPGQKD